MCSKLSAMSKVHIDMLVCFYLQKVSKIFPPTTGGAEKMAADMEVAYLGSIELDPRLGQSCDLGKSFLDEFPESRVGKAYQQISESEPPSQFVAILYVCVSSAAELKQLLSTNSQD